MSVVPVVRVRSGMGEVSRAELLDVDGDRVRIRYLKEVGGRNPESWVHVKRLIDGLPETTIEVGRGPQ